MRRQNKILLGVLAGFPLGYIVFFVLAMLLFVLTMAGALLTASGEPEVNPLVIMGPFMALMGLHLLAMLVIAAQLIVYLVLILRNPTFADNERIFWALGILFAGAFVAPVYWYLKVWPLPDTPPA